MNAPTALYGEVLAFLVNPELIELFRRAEAARNRAKALGLEHEFDIAFAYEAARSKREQGFGPTPEAILQIVVETFEAPEDVIVVEESGLADAMHDLADSLTQETGRSTDVSISWRTADLMRNIAQAVIDRNLIRFEERG